MIDLQITGRHFELDARVVKYAQSKLGQLDRYILKQVPHVHGHVVLEFDKSGREDNSFVCEVSINLPKSQLYAKEATLNMYAAIDICEAKIKSQVLKYKEKHMPKRGRLLKFWKPSDDNS
ncbi:MAG TPA: ribosome-associated translation inhibitor RaiA [Candidatus Dormibacteraeota bacterium]|nr:ribosome-associated translation inhibitor RaiA [Candidatus Dormibacteraeota bacterium]